MANMVAGLSLICVLSIALLFPALSSSQSTFTSSKATYYGSPDCKGTPSIVLFSITSAGACGYGEYGRDVNGGDVAAVDRLYRNGGGCGVCYQIRCKNPELCNDYGVRVVVTDHGASDSADFILSAQAFAKMARPNMGAKLKSYGVADIEYRRISCQYPGNNLMFKVTEHSKYPSYLALVVLYKAGKKDIVAVEVWQEDCKQWKPMRRAYGAVWDTANPPQGALTLRFQAASEEGEVEWVQLIAVIPSDWKAGVAYDTSVQLT